MGIIRIHSVGVIIVFNHLDTVPRGNFSKAAKNSKMDLYEKDFTTALVTVNCN